MSTSSEVPQAQPDGAAKPQQFYARKATGLVRQVPMLDMIFFNANSTTAFTGALAVGLFVVMPAFPRANILLTIVLGIVGCSFIWMSFALLGAAVPKVGGDYVFNGRILHPIFGLAGNLGAFVAAWLAAGFWAVSVVKAGIAPAFGIVGVTTGNHWWVNAGNTLASKGWVFAIAIATVAVMTVLSIFGTKLVMRAQSVFYLVTCVGGLLAFVILLFMSRSTFVSHLNSFSRPFTHQRDTYHATIATAVKGGLQLPDRDGGYSTGNTLGAIYPIIGAAIMWVWWGVYLAAEMKGGGRRNRQLTAIFGAGFGQGLLVLVGAAIFFKTIGYDFFAAANSGSYGVPVAPYFGFFAAIGVHSNLVAILISFAVIFAFPPAVYINLAMCQRAPFAWAWDGLAPQWLTRVSDRYHTPVASILVTFVLVIATTAWAAFSTSFATVFTIFTLTGFVTITITGLSAITMARRRPELYRGSAADWRILGVPVLPVAGVGTVAFSVFMIVEAIRFRTALGVSSLAELLGPPVGVIVVGIVYYLGARAYQQSRGIDLDLAYKSIPPD